MDGRVTYSKTKIDNRISTNETTSIIIRIDMFLLGHEIKNPFNQKRLCKAKSSKCETGDNTGEKIPFEMSSKGPEQGIGSVFVGYDDVNRGSRN